MDGCARCRDSDGYGYGVSEESKENAKEGLFAKRPSPDSSQKFGNEIMQLMTY